MEFQRGKTFPLIHILYISGRINRSANGRIEAEFGQKATLLAGDIILFLYHLTNCLSYISVFPAPKIYLHRHISIYFLKIRILSALHFGLLLVAGIAATLHFGLPLVAGIPATLHVYILCSLERQAALHFYYSLYQ
jgi:hypothetical protein